VDLLDLLAGLTAQLDDKMWQLMETVDLSYG